MTVEFRTEKCSPETALAWLKLARPNQRTISPVSTATLTNVIQQGGWYGDTNGETIKFNPDGELIDGRHRLTAIAESGVTVTLVVAYGVPDVAAKSIDIGRVRTVRDLMKFSGHGEWNQRAGALVAWHLRWERGNYMGNAGGAVTVQPSKMEIIDRWQSDLNGYENAYKRGQDVWRQGFGGDTPAAMGFLLTSEVDPQGAALFYDGFVSGTDQPDDSPIMALRSRLTKRPHTRPVTRAENLALILTAWRKFWTNPTTTRRISLNTRARLTNFTFPKVYNPNLGETENEDPNVED